MPNTIAPITQALSLILPPRGTCITKYGSTLYTSGKNHFHEMNGDVGMAQWK